MQGWRGKEVAVSRMKEKLTRGSDSKFGFQIRRGEREREIERVSFGKFAANAVSDGKAKSRREIKVGRARV